MFLLRLCFILISLFMAHVHLDSSSIMVAKFVLLVADSSFVLLFP